jgi:hypothetical protein
MPYVATQDNRYIGEHSCSQYHYGKQDMVRPCCVADAIERKRNLLRVAMTDSHPAYTLWCAAWNSLTNAECWIVGDVRAVYDHGPAGFKEIDMQGELLLTQ